MADGEDSRAAAVSALAFSEGESGEDEAAVAEAAEPVDSVPKKKAFGTHGRPAEHPLCFACGVEQPVKGSKYCLKHKRAMQNIVNDAASQFEKDAALRILEDKDLGGNMVLDYCSMKEEGKLKRGTKIDWTQWKDTYKVSKGVTDRLAIRKMDWELFKHFWLRERGWSTERSQQEWNKCPPPPPCMLALSKQRFLSGFPWLQRLRLACLTVCMVSGFRHHQ